MFDKFLLASSIPHSIFAGNEEKVCYYKALEKSHTEYVAEDFQRLVVEAEIASLQRYLSIMGE